MITPVGEASAVAAVSASVKRAVEIRLNFFIGFSSRFDISGKGRRKLAGGRLICQSNWIKLRKVDDCAVSLHLTLGAFKINVEIFAAARKFDGRWQSSYIFLGATKQNCCRGARKMAEHDRILLYFTSVPQSASIHTGGKDDSQTQPRFHFFADLFHSRHIDALFQSKVGTAPAEIAHDA